MAAHRGTLPSATPPVVTPCTTLHSWPGSWLPSPAPASLTTGGAAAECPAPWQCGDMPGWSRRVRGCRVPNCRGAAKQWSPLASSSPHTAAASVDTIRGRRVSGGRVHPRVGGSGDLQHVTSCSCWGRGWRWWRGRAAARGLPLHWSWLLGAAAAEEME